MSIPHSEALFRAANPTVLRLYDGGTDQFRNATQADLDLLVYGASRIAVVREFFDKLHEEYKQRALAVFRARFPDECA